MCAWESDGQLKADLGIRLGFPLMFLEPTAMAPSNINVTANLYILYHTFRFLSSLLGSPRYSAPAGSNNPAEAPLYE
jgi:hypothetical protein